MTRTWYWLITLFSITGRALAEGSTSSCGDLPSGSKLIHLSMVYRHGERNPISEYPKSKYVEESNWKEGFGQLTLEGMKQHFRFGRWIAEHYGSHGVGFLPAVYNVRDYKAVSTDVDRTFMSAMANAAGIYLPEEGLGIAKNILWTPVTTNRLIGGPNEVIFAQNCPLANEKYTELRDKRFEELRRKNPEIFMYSDKFSGYGIAEHPYRIFWLYDTATVENIIKRELPPWLQRIWPNPLQYYYMEFLKLYIATEELARVNAGFTLKNIIETMKNKTLGKDSIKLNVYSAHDNNVYNILGAMGVPPKEPPGFTSAVIFELYEAPTGRYYIKVLYRPDINTEPHPLKIPGCGGGETCRMESFIETTQHLIPKDYASECTGPK